jgi:hypothetical protein
MIRQQRQAMFLVADEDAACRFDHGYLSFATDVGNGNIAMCNRAGKVQMAMQDTVTVSVPCEQNIWKHGYSFQKNRAFAPNKEYEVFVFG